MQRPAHPEPVRTDKDGTDSAFDRWLSLFYNWLKTLLQGVVSAASGNVFYSDGAGNITSEAAFNYNATTNTLNLGSLVTTATVTVGTYIDLQEIADPGYAAANHAYLHAEDVAGITQIHHNTSGHKWTIGQDNWIVARNVTGSSIPALRAVYISGSTGARPQITMADADLHQHAIGVTQDTIADNGYGAVVVSGYVKGVNTSGWTAGDALYLSSTAGVLTNSAPAFPAAKQRVATVIYSHASQGIIQVFHHEDTREGDGTWETPFTIGDGTTAGELRLLEPSGLNYTAFKTQAQAGDLTYTLPAAHGTFGVLLNNGSGTLTWDTDISDLIDHGLLNGLADDDHTQYVLLAGRSGGQIIRGGTGASDNLTLRSTSNATKGNILLADEGGNVVLGGGATASELRFLEPSGSGTNYTAFKAQAQAGNVTYTLPAAAPTADGQTLSGTMAGVLSWAASGGGAEMKRSIAQTGHGFSVGNVLYHNGTTYALADKDAEATAEVVGIVQAVTDTDNYVLQYGGYIDTLSGLTAGTVYFLGDSGALTATEPTTAGQISKPLLIAVSTTAGYFFNMRGQEIGGGVAQIVAPTLPGGRLTLTSGTPVMSAEAAAQTTIYYTPYVGDLVPIYDGSAWNMKQFTELSIAMAGSANWASGSNYDLYIADDNGTLRLVTGAAWTNDTTRSESLTRLNGILVNNASMTGRYGPSSTVSIAAQRATYVGTFRASANGTTTWELGGAAAGGEPGFLYMWNMYNRRPVALQVCDSTDSWTYTTLTIRSKNGSTANRVTFVHGLNEDSVTARHDGVYTNSGGSVSAYMGVGLDTTSAHSGIQNAQTVGAAGTLAFAFGSYEGRPGLGLHYVQAVEESNATGTTTHYGDAGIPAHVQSGLAFTGWF